MTSPVTFTTVKDARSVAELWDSMTEADSASSIYTSSAWCLAAWRHLPHLGSPLLLGEVAGRRLVGVLPLTAGPEGITWAGSPLGDEHDVLISGRERRRTVIALLNAAREEAGSDTSVHLQHVRPGGLLTDVVTGTPGCPSPVIALQSADPGFGALACMPGWSHNRRKKLRRARRQLSDRGRLTYHRVTAPAEVAAALPHFVTARRTSWEQRGRVHELPAIDLHHRFPTFIADAGGELAKRGRCFLAVLSLDGTPIAQALMFRTASALLLYMSTYEPYFARYSPSHLLLSEIAAQAVGAGVRTLELGRGDEPYKFDLGAVPRQLRDLLLSP